MDDWKCNFPGGFESEKSYSAFLDSKLEAAFETFLIGTGLTPLQQNSVRSFGWWCIILGLAARQLDKKEAVEKWDLDSKRLFKKILNARLEKQLNGILKASEDNPWRGTEGRVV
jgi:hypothetical protein